MNNQIKTTILWIIIVFGITLHSVLEVVEGFYFAVLPEEPFNEGIPTVSHVIFIMAMLVPLIFSVITLFSKSKAFIWISLIYGALLALLNIFHVIEDGNLENITQLILLSLVAIINVLLVITINNWRKEIKTA